MNGRIIAIAAITLGVIGTGALDASVATRVAAVGWAGTAVGKQRRHGFAWARGRMTDLGTLGGDESEAFAINNRGQIIGWSETKTGDTHAVLWNPIR